MSDFADLGTARRLLDGDRDTSITVEQPLGTDTDNIVFTTDGYERARITLEGNVGIGISAPTSLLHVAGDIRAEGNFIVDGYTTSIMSEVLNISDNHIYLNKGYTIPLALTGGLVVNYLPTATSDTVAGAGFIAGAGATNPTIGTTGASTFSTGNFIQVSGADDPLNDGLYEVLSHAANVLTIRGIGTVNTVEDFTQTQIFTDSTTIGTITNVNISVIRTGTDGTWETGFGSSTPLIFLDLASIPHALLHILGGIDELDGDRVGIDFTPANYIPSIAPPEATDVDHLTAHLSGIDTAIAVVEPLSDTLESGNTTDGYDIDLNSGSALISSDGNVTVNDNLDVFGDGYISGKLTVDGLIDPTGLVLSEQSADPRSTGAGEGTFWVRDDAETSPVFTSSDGTDYIFNEASSIKYDPATSGMVATNMQTAIDELDGYVDALRIPETLAEILSSGNTTDGTNIDLNSGSTLISSDGNVTVNDNLDVFGDGYISGKLTVAGLIDPTGLVLSEQSVDPRGTGAGEGTFWIRDDAETSPVFTSSGGTDYIFNEASSIKYDSATSGMGATDLQAAIDELDGYVDVLTNYIARFTPNDNQAPIVDFATSGLRNDHQILEFDDGYIVLIESAMFASVLPSYYSGGTFEVTLIWAAEIAIVGDVRWRVSFERNNDGVFNIDVDSFGTASTVTSPTDGYNGVVTYAKLSSVAASGLVAGEGFRLKVERVGSDIADSMLDDAQLLRVLVEES